MAAFTLAAGAILWYAIPEGSYDIVPRQEEAIAVWWVIGLGAALGLLPRAKMRRERVWALVPLVLLVAWTALALLWTSSDERSFAELVRVAHYAGIVLLIWFLVSPATWRPAAAGLAVAAVGICALALASRIVPAQFPDSVARAFNPQRLSYPLGYWNAVAAWGAMSVAMTLVWSAHARTLAVRAASLAAVPVAVLTVYLTYSRAGVGGIAIALIAAVAFSVNRWTVAAHALIAAAASTLVLVVVRGQREIADGAGSGGAADVLMALLGGALLCVLGAFATRLLRADRWRLHVRVARVAAVSVAAVLLVAFATLGRAPLSDAWGDFKNTGIATTSTAQPSDLSTRLKSLKGTRYEVYSSALRALRDEPLHGIGPGTFEFRWNREGGRQFLRDAHSLYLEQAAELGLPGAALTITFLVALGALAVAARLRLRDPSHAGAAAALCAAFVVFLFHAGVDWMWESTAVTVLALTAIALAAASVRRPRAVPERRLRVGLALLAVCACALALPGLLSTTKLRASREAFARGDRALALAEADAAVSRQPAAASPYVQRALVRWAEGDLAAAGADLGRARKREPLNWRHPLLVARLEAERGRTRTAIRAFRDAKRLRPASPFLARPPKPAPARHR